MADRRLPVAVVTGFLGSGKTTLLSRVLVHPSMGETAVIVNELGEIAIDHHLLRQVDERTVVLASGCVCCSLRGDLADELRDLLERREQGELPPFRRVVVETTGLAEPAPILATLLSEPALRHRYRPEIVITTVDATTGQRVLGRHAASAKQAAAADRIVVTKSDLADEVTVDGLVARLEELNPTAEGVRESFGKLAPAALFRKRGPGASPAAPSIEHGDHDGIRALTLTCDRPLDWTAFGIWLTMLLQARGEDILRVKGLVDTGGTGPVVLNGVQHAVYPPLHLDAWPDSDRRSRIVFIARGVELDELEASVAAFNRAARSA
jgi:G3E family GTPase